MYVCIYIYIYMCVYIYIYTHILGCNILPPGDRGSGEGGGPPFVVIVLLLAGK